MSKVILIDSNVISHIAIFSWGGMQKLKSEGKLQKDALIMEVDYIYFNTIQSYLKKVGVDRDDLIIVCVDARNSWRKFFLDTYKGQRREFRESHEEINWLDKWGKIDRINNLLNQSTNWQFIKVSQFINTEELNATKEAQELKIQRTEMDWFYGLEVDDIIASAVKFFKDRDIVILSCDKDLTQLCDNKRVKFFSTHTKYYGKKGLYSIVDDPIKVLADKVRKGDVGDNILVNKDTDTEHDKLVRRLIIDLINLPEWVKEPVFDILKLMKPKEMDYKNLPFPNSLGQQNRFDKIYAKDNIITIEDAERVLTKRDEAKKKKQKEKRAEKKAESLR